jgi:hypothetical protein
MLRCGGSISRQFRSGPGSIPGLGTNIKAHGRILFLAILFSFGDFFFVLSVESRGPDLWQYWVVEE